MDLILKILAVLLFIIVAWLSLAPATVNYSPGAPTAPLVPLLARMAILFVLSITVFLAWRHNVIPAVIFMFIAAFVFEIGQIYSVNRDFSVEDLLGNIMGVLMAYLFFRALWQFSHRIHR